MAKLSDEELKKLIKKQEGPDLEDPEYFTNEPIEERLGGFTGDDIPLDAEQNEGSMIDEDEESILEGSDQEPDLKDLEDFEELEDEEEF